MDEVNWNLFKENCLSLSKWIQNSIIGIATLIVVLAWANYWNVSKGDDALMHFANYEVKVLQISLKLQEKFLNCRRYEKDMFLNMAKPDKVEKYWGKFQKAVSDVEQGFSELEQILAKIEEPPDSILKAPKEAKGFMQTYFEGVKGLHAKIGMDASLSPAGLNSQMKPFKQSVYGATNIIKRVGDFSERNTQSYIKAASLSL